MKQAAKNLARLTVQIVLGLVIGLALIGPLHPWVKQIGLLTGVAIAAFLVFAWIVERRNRPDSD